MVLDRIENLRRYESLNPLFVKAFDFIDQTDFNKLELGKHVIDGENVFALLMEYQTKDMQDCMLEGHRKYIDVQYMIDGNEFIGITSFVNQPPHIDYDPTKDLIFFKGDCDNNVKLSAGNFTIFFPEDLHMPSVKIGTISKVRKVVVKILVNAER